MTDEDGASRPAGGPAVSAAPSLPEPKIRRQWNEGRGQPSVRTPVREATEPAPLPGAGRVAGRLASAREPHLIRIPTRDLHYAGVHKERKNNRVMRVTRRVVLSGPAEVEARLEESTYSSTVNTSGVERENGKLRADCARAARPARASRRR